MAVHSRIKLGIAALTVALIPVATTTAVSAQDAPVLCDGHVATIVGTPGDDDLLGTKGDDVIAGLQGNDFIEGRGGDDIICAAKATT